LIGGGLVDEAPAEREGDPPGKPAGNASVSATAVVRGCEITGAITEASAADIAKGGSPLRAKITVSNSLPEKRKLTLAYQVISQSDQDPADVFLFAAHEIGPHSGSRTFEATPLRLFLPPTPSTTGAMEAVCSGSSLSKPTSRPRSCRP